MTNKTVVPASVTKKIVEAFSGVFRKAFDQSNLVHTVCEVIGEDYSEAVPAAHQKEMIDAIVSDNPQWKGRTIDSRKSECRAIMRSHHVLETFTDAVKADKRCEGFTWHNAVKVARIWVRQSKKGTPSPKKVVAEYFKKNKAAQADPLDKLATDILNSASKSAFILALQQVCADHGYELS